MSTETGALDQTPPGPAHARAETTDVLTPARRVVLDVLGAARQAVTVAEVAGTTGLHLNTVREHLEALVDAGFASRGRLAPQGRGRPASTYEYAPQADMLSPGYGLMTSAMVDYVAAVFGDSPALAEHAYRAGLHWGEKIGEQDLLRRAAGEPLDATIDLFDEAGFAPTVHTTSEGRTEVRLFRCPVLTMARSYPDLVCRSHQGMADACLGASRPVDATGATCAPADAEESGQESGEEPNEDGGPFSRLEAFVNPGYCSYVIDVPVDDSGLVLGDEAVGPLGPAAPPRS